MIIDLRDARDVYQIPLRTALHIGAHLGEEDGIYREMGVTPIYVEANPEVFKQLIAKVPERECHQVAISNKIGDIEFHLTSFDQSSSILPLKKHSEIYPSIVEAGVIRVPCTTIDQLLADRCASIDLLNLDIQGAELLAFQGAEQTLPHVKCIVTEVNRAELYEGCGLIGDLDAFLERFDFKRVETSFKYHPTWGDAMYVKSAYAIERTWFNRLGHWFHRRMRRAG